MEEHSNICNFVSENMWEFKECVSAAALSYVRDTKLSVPNVFLNIQFIESWLRL